MHNRGATTLLSAIHVSMSSIEEHAFTRLAGMFFPRSSIKIANGAFHLPYRKQTRSKKKKTRDENCRCHLYFGGAERGESRELPSKLRIDGG